MATAPMSWHRVVYTLPLLLTAGGMASLALYVALKRRTVEARIFTVLTLAVAAWSLAYALELGCVDVFVKLFWAKLKYVGIVIVPTAWLLFTIQYTGRRHWLRSPRISLLSIGPVATLILVWTNESHSLFWTGRAVEVKGLLNVLSLPVGGGFWFCAGYNYLILLLGTLFLIEAFFRSHVLYRRQVGMMLAASVVPWIGNVLFLTGLSPIHHLDLTPFAFGATCVMVAWTLFRLHLTDLMPIAHASVVESIHDGVIVLDPQHRVIGLNPSAQLLASHTDSETIGESVSVAFPELTALLDLSDSRGLVEKEAVLQKDASRSIFDVRVSPLTDGQGRFMGRIAVLRDITGRKEAEEKLEGSLSLLSATLESTADGILVVHTSGRIVAFNRRFLKMWHIPEAHVVFGNDLQSQQIILNQLKQPEKFVDKLRDLCESRDEEVSDLVELEDGRIFEWNTQPRKVGETVIGRVLSFRDITRQKLLEKQLRDTKNHLESLLENANDAIYMLDLDGNLTYVNHRSEAITGFSRQELLGQDIASIVHPDDLSRVLEHFKIDGNGTTRVARVRFIRKDDHIVTLSINHTPIVKEDETVGVFGIARDITREVELEVKLGQAQKLEAVGQLAAGVAHDFSNLLTVIIGHTELAIMKDDRESSARENLREVKMAAEHAADLVGKLLAFGRRQTVQAKVLDLNLTISKMQELLRGLVGEDTDFRVKQAPDLWRIMADPIQMEQVLINLVVNASDAMSGGGSLLLETDNIEIRSDGTQAYGGIKPGRYAMLAVTDTGHGMSKNIQQSIFDPFFTTKPQGQGSGLGLSTVYGIIRQHGGEIYLHSEIDRGTTVKVFMPVSDTEEAAEHTLASHRTPNGSGIILIVEDDESVRKMISATLSELDYNVWEAPGDLQALDLLDRYSLTPDLLITNEGSPGVGGEKLAELCEKRFPGTRVLFISDDTDRDIHNNRVLGRGAEFLQKPFTPVSLALKVSEMMPDSTPVSEREERL